MHEPRSNVFGEGDPVRLCAGSDAALRPGAWLEAAVAAEARVMTPAGPRPAGRLRPGDPVMTLDDGPAMVLWIGRRRVTAEGLGADMRPVVLAPGSVSDGVPRRRLRLSPRAGLWRPLPRCDTGVLVPAAELTSQASVNEAVDYVQILLERHALIAAEGALVESLHPARLGRHPEAAGLRAAVHGAFPLLDHDPDAYGPEIRPRAVRRQ